MVGDCFTRSMWTVVSNGPGHGQVHLPSNSLPKLFDSRVVEWSGAFAFEIDSAITGQPRVKMCLRNRF